MSVSSSDEPHLWLNLRVSLLWSQGGIPTMKNWSAYVWIYSQFTALPLRSLSLGVNTHTPHTYTHTASQPLWSICSWTRCVCYCCSVPKACLTLCDPMDCSTPAFPVLHCLLKLAQTHVHWVGDAIQPSHPVALFSSCPQSFSASRSFPVSGLFTSGGQVTGASASVLPKEVRFDFL